MGVKNENFCQAVSYVELIFGSKKFGIKNYLGPLCVYYVNYHMRVYFLCESSYESIFTM